MSKLNWKLILSLRDQFQPELVSSYFTSPYLSKPVISNRQLGHMNRVVGSFNWTRAIRAITIFGIKAKLHRLYGSIESPILIGGKGSAAYALANYIYVSSFQGTIFGHLPNGMSTASRMVEISNGRLKNPRQPISIYLREEVFPNQSDIQFMLDGFPVTKSKELENLVIRIGGKDLLIDYLIQPNPLSEYQKLSKSPLIY